jgi:hypothetical protein
MSLKAGYNKCSILRLAIFENMSHNIVLQSNLITHLLLWQPSTHPKSILHQVDSILVEFVYERSHLLLSQVLETSSKNAVSIWMGRQLENTALEGRNEAQTVSRHIFDKLLHNLEACQKRRQIGKGRTNTMAICIFDALKHVWL